MKFNSSEAMDRDSSELLKFFLGTGGGSNTPSSALSSSSEVEQEFSKSLSASCCGGWSPRCCCWLVFEDKLDFAAKFKYKNKIHI